MFFYRIQNRLIVAFILIVTIILLASAWSLHWMVRQSLERELGRRLEAVANSASILLAEEGSALFSGAESASLFDYLSGQLNALKNQTQVQRIYVFDWQYQNLLDTDTNGTQGRIDYNLQFYASELAKLKTGQSSHSVLFQGVDGQPTMSGYAPFFVGSSIPGGVGVDGSATFLHEMDRLTRRLLGLSLLTLIFAFVAAVMLARTITRPMTQLTRASRVISEGEYHQTIPDVGKSEIGVLGQTMEEMRQNVLQRDQELKGMLAGVAHEIRNPLGGMELFSGLLQDEVRGNQQAEGHVARIQKEISYLKNIVTSFLDYAKPQKPQKSGIEIQLLLDEIKELYQKQLGTQQITCEIHCPDILINVDPQHAKRILTNLVQNAIQAMPNGGKLTVRFSDEDDFAALLIEDTGCGIPDEDQTHMFVPFFTNRDQGTGLGLSIVKNLIEANGGRINLIKSDPNGTTFAVSFQKYQT